jgi:hypothetical protein
VPIKPTVQQVGQPRHASAVRVNSGSEIAPTTETREIAITPTTAPAKPLSKCTRTDLLASGELLPMAGPGIPSRVANIHTSCAVEPAADHRSCGVAARAGRFA